MSRPCPITRYGRGLDETRPWHRERMAAALDPTNKTCLISPHGDENKECHHGFASPTIQRDDEKRNEDNNNNKNSSTNSDRPPPSSYCENLYGYIRLAEYQTEEQEINVFPFYWIMGGQATTQNRGFMSALGDVIEKHKEDMMLPGDDEHRNRNEYRTEGGVDGGTSTVARGGDTTTAASTTSEAGNSPAAAAGAGVTTPPPAAEKEDEDEDEELKMKRISMKNIHPDMPRILRHMAVLCFDEFDVNDARLYCQIATKLDYVLHCQDMGCYCRYVEQEQDPPPDDAVGRQRLLEYFQQVVLIHTNIGLVHYLASRISCQCLENFMVPKDSCDGCGENVCGDRDKENNGLSRCSRCKEVYYCSRRSQQADWNRGHKWCCKRIVQVKARIAKLQQQNEQSDGQQKASS